MPISLNGITVAVLVTALVGCTSSNDEDTPTTRALERELVDLSRVDELALVADMIERRLPDASDQTFTASVTALLRQFEYAEVRAERAPRFTGVVKSQPHTVRFRGGVDEVVNLLGVMQTYERPWKLDRLHFDDQVVTLEMRAFVFASGVLEETHVEPSATPRVKALEERIADRRAALKLKGYDAEALQRLRRVSMKQSLVGDLQKKAEARGGDLRLFLDTIRETKHVPREIAFDDSRGKQRCRLVLESDVRGRFVRAASRRGAINDRHNDELILASGRVCRVAISDE